MIVKFWHDGTLQKQNQISEHGVFPWVYDWVEQQGAWKLHPCYPMILYAYFNALYWLISDIQGV